MKKAIWVTSSAVAAAVAVAAVVVGKCWNGRDTDESRRQVRRETLKAMRAVPPDGVVRALEDLRSTKSLHTWFVTDSPWKFWGLRAGFLAKVPYDFIARLAEDQFIRFAGNGSDVKPDAAVLKGLLEFSGRLLPQCGQAAANSLRERRLDGYFLTGDFDGAIAILENGGVPGKSPAWCKGTASKLRAHKAMDAGDRKEAVARLLEFVGFMKSDEQKDFEECDPTTGILYSREWVLARNLMRCSKMTAELGDAAKAGEYKAEAAKCFATALEKAKDDEKSLASLKEEMKSAGL